MGKQNSMRRLAVAVAGAVLAIAGSGQAAFTTINPPAPGEASQAQILSHAYGGTFTQNGLNFTNGHVKLVRVDDNDDQTFDFNISSVKTLATFSGYSQGLGIENASGTTDLFHVKGKGFAATGTSGPVTATGPYSFVRTGYGDAMSSNASQNIDGQDHMVTYILEGKGMKTMSLVMFFEDAPVQKHSDFDFNDLAVQVTGTCDPVVPLPAAAWSGLVTMVGGVAVSGARKLRSQLA